MARVKAPPPAEERKLIAMIGVDGQPGEKRKRGTIIQGVLGFTDDGYVIHVPTGFNVDPPKDAAGEYRTDCLNDRKFIEWMLAQDPDAWASSRNYKLGERLTGSLRDRLVKTRDSYPGDE